MCVCSEFGMAREASTDPRCQAERERATFLWLLLFSSFKHRLSATGALRPLNGLKRTVITSPRWSSFLSSGALWQKLESQEQEGKEGCFSSLRHQNRSLIATYVWVSRFSFKMIMKRHLKPTGKTHSLRAASSQTSGVIQLERTWLMTAPEISGTLTNLNCWCMMT